MANEGTAPPLEVCENGQDPHVRKPNCCAHEALAVVLSEITIYPVKLPGNDFYSVIAEDMAAPLVEALAAAGLLRDQPAETWTQYGVRLTNPSPYLSRGVTDGHLIVGDDFTGCPDELELMATVRAAAEHGMAAKRTLSAGPWRPVDVGKEADDVD